MKLSELYKDILIQITDSFYAEGKISEDVKEDIINQIDFPGSEPDERHWFDDIADKGIYTQYITSMLSLENSSDREVESDWHVKNADANVEYQREVKPFFIHTPNDKVCAITASKLKAFSDGTDADDGIFTVVSLIWAVLKNNRTEMNKFWDFCRSNHPLSYYIISKDEISDNDKLWDAFAYANLAKVNVSKFDLPTDMFFDNTVPLMPNLLFDGATPYQQYFDIIHILSEAKHCDDILSRYLRTYQVLENLSYRHKIVKLANSDISKNGFIRNTVRIIGDVSNKEKEHITKSISTLFPSIDSDIDEALLNSHQPFLEDNLGIKRGEQHNAMKVAKLIYQLRNNIVHNKYTEFHFSYGNIDEYREIIPLIKKIIEVLDKEIVNLLNVNTHTEIDYQNKEFYVY